jgi:hypothetical protein
LQKQPRFLPPVAIVGDFHFKKHLFNELVLDIVDSAQVAPDAFLQFGLLLGSGEIQKVGYDKVEGVTPSATIPVVVTPLFVNACLGVDDDLLKKPLPFLAIQL